MDDHKPEGPASMEKIRVETPSDGVYLVTLTDPGRRNAMGAKMGEELRAFAAEVAEDAGARAVVVTGEGKAFCAGADLPALFGDPDRHVTDQHALLAEYYQAFLDIYRLPIPTIAAVNGAAVGAGLNLATACDIRIAGTYASFAATFAKIGLHPGGGCTHFLVQAIGQSRALRTLLLGEAIDAERAVAWGLADGPEDDPVGTATELATAMAGIDGPLSRHIKKSVRIAASTGDLNATLEYETWAQAASASSDTLQAWVDRFR